LTAWPTGNKTGDALAAVLADQAERKQRQETKPEPKDRSQIARKLVIPLPVVTLWFVFAPPAALRPPAVPTFAEVGNGLHMDIYVVASQVLRYRNVNGLLPSTLLEALPGPEAAEGLTYNPRSDGIFEIGGERDAHVVVYLSTQSLTQFVSSARSAIREGPGS
jgi:hypothetical protein